MRHLATDFASLTAKFFRALQQILRVFLQKFRKKRTSACAAFRKKVNPLLAGGCTAGKRSDFPRFHADLAYLPRQPLPDKNCGLPRIPNSVHRRCRLHYIKERRKWQRYSKKMYMEFFGESQPPRLSRLPRCPNRPSPPPVAPFCPPPSPINRVKDCGRRR